MIQDDFVGDLPKKKFVDIRNTRDKVAEEKARLCMLLKERCDRIPQHIKTGGSVEEVRAWKKDREAALKICANKRSSTNELEGALNLMAKYS